MSGAKKTGKWRFCGSNFLLKKQVIKGFPAGVPSPPAVLKGVEGIQAFNLDNFLTTLEQLWNKFGTTLGQLWDYFETTFGLLWDNQHHLFSKESKLSILPPWCGGWAIEMQNINGSVSYQICFCHKLRLTSWWFKNDMRNILWALVLQCFLTKASPLSFWSGLCEHNFDKRLSTKGD